MNQRDQSPFDSFDEFADEISSYVPWIMLAVGFAIGFILRSMW